LEHLHNFVLLLSAYFIGCLSTGFYITYLMAGQDIRKIGSGSTGATNVKRVLGKKGFYLTLAGDALKGFFTVLWAYYLDVEAYMVVLAITFCVAGHIFPVQLKFKGGKGLAVALGGFLTFDYRLILSFFVCYGILYLTLRKKYMLSGIIVIALFPVFAYFAGHRNSVLLIISLLTILVLYAHKDNIIHLWKQYFNIQKNKTE